MSTYKELRGLRVKYVPTDTTSPSTAAAGDVWYNSTEGKLKAYVGRAAWSAGSNMNTARQNIAGSGTQTAGHAFGGSTGSVSNASEEYNGSGWSEGNNLNTARRLLAGFGIQTAGIGAGGYTPGTNLMDIAESYDGLPEAVVMDQSIHPFMIGVQFHPERLGKDNLIHIKMKENFYKQIEKRQSFQD